MVSLRSIRPGLCDGLPEEDQNAIAALVSKSVLLVDEDGRAELHFNDLECCQRSVRQAASCRDRVFAVIVIAADTLVVRTSLSDPSSIVPAVRRAVNEVDSSVPLANAEEMQVIVDRSMSRVSFVMVLLGISAAVALFLAAIGLYVVVSYVVARRTHEIGLRIALGAQRGEVERFVVGRSLRPVVGGLVLGTLVALLLAQLLRGLLFGVEPTSPAAYVASAALLAAVAMLASWMPARRAARLEPTVALRAD